MKGKKRFIVTMLFFINIIMLVAAVIPHHHHPNGMICMKQDQPVEQQCPNHHHHPASDSCCSSECMTRFHSPIPSVHTDSGPNYEQGDYGSYSANLSSRTECTTSAGIAGNTGEQKL